MEQHDLALAALATAKQIAPEKDPKAFLLEARILRAMNRPYSRARYLEIVAALRALGVGVDRAQGVIAVTPFRMRGPASVDCGLAGTVMRFVPRAVRSC